MHLRFDGPQGYLRSVLEALSVPIESQIAVFSRTSLQAARISPQNPRAIYFNDSVAAAWMPGGFIELASHDPQRGVIFHVLEQQPLADPSFTRREDCLLCHVSDASLGVPGMMIRSVFPARDGGARLIHGAFLTDHRSPLAERWGGYFVTGVDGPARHMGNTVLADDDHPEAMTATRFDPVNYFAPSSDAAALLVFNHQMHMMNLITRAGWEIRAAPPNRVEQVARDLAAEFVGYLLFIDEAPLTGLIHSAPSAFARAFAARGPRDHLGRSLRDLDLTRRLLRYPCSYMIYSPAFDALPAPAKSAIYARMLQVLSTRVSPADSRAILEILRDTKEDFPGAVTKSPPAHLQH